MGKLCKSTAMELGSPSELLGGKQHTFSANSLVFYRRLNKRYQALKRDSVPAMLKCAIKSLSKLFHIKTKYLYPEGTHRKSPSTETEVIIYI